MYYWAVGAPSWMNVRSVRFYIVIPTLNITDPSLNGILEVKQQGMKLSFLLQNTLDPTIITAKVNLDSLNKEYFMPISYLPTSECPEKLQSAPLVMSCKPRYHNWSSRPAFDFLKTLMVNAQDNG